MQSQQSEPGGSVLSLSFCVSLKNFDWNVKESRILEDKTWILFHKQPRKKINDLMYVPGKTNRDHVDLTASSKWPLIIWILIDTGTKSQWWLTVLKAFILPGMWSAGITTWCQLALLEWNTGPCPSSAILVCASQQSFSTLNCNSFFLISICEKMWLTVI